MRRYITSFLLGVLLLGVNATAAANDYFTHSSTISSHTLARVSTLNSIFSAIESGFDDLPGEAELKEGRVTYVELGGSANAYTGSLTYTPSTYTAGMTVIAEIPAANTGASTINLNALGVKAVKRIDGEDLVAGDLPENAVVTMTYTNQGYFVVTTLVGDAVSASASASAAASSASAAATSASAASSSASSAAASVTASIARNGSTQPTANINWGGFEITNLDGGESAGEALAYGQDGANFTSTDAGANAAPTITLDRDSESPADSDALGELLFQGEDSAGNDQEYASIYGEARDVTSGTEDGGLRFRITIDGAVDQEVFRLGSGFTTTTVSSDGGASAGPSSILKRDSASPADNDLGADLRYDMDNDAAEQTTIAGIRVRLEDASDGTEDGHLEFRSMRAGSEVNSLSPGIQYATVTASGATVAFTGIPPYARKITVMLTGLSGDGTDNIEIALGDGGGIETADYVTRHTTITGSTAATTTPPTDAFLLVNGLASDDWATGVIRLELADPASNTWLVDAQLSGFGASSIQFITGNKSLSATLDQLQLQLSGTDEFDAGDVSIRVE